MRARPRPELALAAFLALAAAVAGASWAIATRGGEHAAAVSGAGSWRGLVDVRAPVSTGENAIVLLRTPSLARRLARVGYATESQERAWTSQAFAAQRQVLTQLAVEGATVQPTFSYARVVDGFAAALDPRAVALLERNPEVTGIYPTRAAFPASLSDENAQAERDTGPPVRLPGSDGTGITIALLDTGVDGAQPSLRGRLEPGYDVVGGGDDTSPRADPQDPSRVETHGTELAGLLVGSGRPAGPRGVAPGATVLPIRVAGWQPADDGRSAVYARSDQLLAGLERAVDPNGDGDSHDAARIALVGVAEPYASFTDGPEARAVQGAAALDTLVVAPAGNDGAAGPLFGSVAGPAGVPGALAVGAADARPVLPAVRVVLRRGLEVVLDRLLPLFGPAAPDRPLSLRVAAPRATHGTAGSAAADVFDARGLSIAAGRAVVVPLGADPESTVENAARAGAAAVLFYGRHVPAGGLRLGAEPAIPVVAVPTAQAVELLAARRAGIDVGVALGRATGDANTGLGAVASFSSRGLAFDGGVKPDVVAPGIGLATLEPGRAADGSPHEGTVDGTSAAAALVAGAAALVGEARPGVDAADLESLLVGYADPAGSMLSAGGGRLDVGASAVGEVTASPATLSFGTWTGARWRSTRTLVLHNVSTRRLVLALTAASSGDPEALHIAVTPARVALRAGRVATVTVTVTAPRRLTAPAVTGAIRVAAAGAATLRVPFAIGFGAQPKSLIGHASLSAAAFTPSDTSPAVLNVQAGNVVSGAGGAVQIEAVSRLDVLLSDANGRFRGLLARQRDLLPGSYSFGISGRDPASRRLPPGRYELRLVA
ncbi:MAG TPA: S8 family serine peptidase, partial [Gaiellaceae bacterium]|nr:S8 family serine peptidase [Gaiellaceae bacterium]